MDIAAGRCVLERISGPIPCPVDTAIVHFVALRPVAYIPVPVVGVFGKQRVVNPKQPFCSNTTAFRDTAGVIGNGEYGLFDIAGGLKRCPRVEHIVRRQASAIYGLIAKIGDAGAGRRLRNTVGHALEQIASGCEIVDQGCPKY